MKRSLITLALAAACGFSGAAFGAPAEIALPTGWSIAAPAGPVAAVGTLPGGIVLSRDATRVTVVDTGHGPAGVRVLDAATLRPVRTVALPNAFGAPLPDAGDDGVWIANTQTFGEQIAHLSDAGEIDRTVSLPAPFFASALARSPDGTTLAVAGDRSASIAFVDIARGAVVATVPVGRHPAALAYAADGTRLFVAGRAGRSIDVLDPVRHAALEPIAVGLHPDALAIDDRRLYVADADDDDVAVVDLATRRVSARVPLPFVRDGLVGSSPNALLLDGDRLYVSCGAANAVAVYRRTADGLAPLGAVAAGWYPTGLAIDARAGALYVLNGKGEGGHPNPGFRPGKNAGYIADNLVGSIRRLAVPSDDALRAGLATVRALAQNAALPRHPVVRAHGPIAHVIYVIKENRTYDQVLGDLPNADGDPSLVMFGAAITPNQHALARRFGVFDRFFDNAHVSADGHNWSLAGFANDYLEKMWPPQYAGRRPDYDFEDGAEAAVPHAGYLWDAAARAHVSARNYGEFVTAGPHGGLPVSTAFDTLRPITDPNYPTFDMHISDMARFTEWAREFDAYERSGTLPMLEIVRLPRDHTAGTRSGENTPQAMVADNDRAVGALVERVSHARDWAHTAIFILEDDAQNGPDHVDEQRSTLYLASPYATGGIMHGRYTTASVLRTIEVLLGLQPLSPYDAGAEPLSAAFGPRPDLRPFDALPAQTDLDARNNAAAYRAADSGRLDLAHADAVPAAELNEILWRAVKGPRASPPPYGAFAAR